MIFTSDQSQIITCTHLPRPTNTCIRTYTLKMGANTEICMRIKNVNACISISNSDVRSNLYLYYPNHDSKWTL